MAGWQARALGHGDGNADFNSIGIGEMHCHKILDLHLLLMYWRSQADW